MIAGMAGQLRLEFIGLCPSLEHRFLVSVSFVDAIANVLKSTKTRYFRHDDSIVCFAAFRVYFYTNKFGN